MHVQENTGIEDDNLIKTVKKFNLAVKIDLLEVVCYFKLFKQVLHLLSKLYDKSVMPEEALLIFYLVIDSCII